MIITKTPFRVSFVGGGTDIENYYSVNGGAVVSAAINKYMYITVNKHFDKKIRVSYSETEIVDRPEELRHDIIRECLNLVGIESGIEITSISDIPKGTGLGSSSAFTVGLLNALFTYTGRTLSAHELAESASFIEIERLGAPIGKQDQYACACGGVNLFEFKENGNVSRKRIILSEADYKKSDRKLMLFYLGQTREANRILFEQQKASKKNQQVLDEMKQEAYSLYDHLIHTGFDASFGSYLNEGWKRKKTLAESISNSQIDEHYSRAINAGATGGKLLGAGGNGFLLFYCEEANQVAVREALQLKEVDFRFAPYGTRVVYFA